MGETLNEYTLAGLFDLLDETPLDPADLQALLNEDAPLSAAMADHDTDLIYIPTGRRSLTKYTRAFQEKLRAALVNVRSGAL